METIQDLSLDLHSRHALFPYAFARAIGQYTWFVIFCPAGMDCEVTTNGWSNVHDLTEQPSLQRGVDSGISLLFDNTQEFVLIAATGRTESR